MQQPGPPSKLSRSHSADNLAVRKADPPRAPPFTYGANLADEVDYGDSPDPSAPACLGGRRLAAMTLPRLGQPNLSGRTNQTWMKLPVRAGPKESSL